MWLSMDRIDSSFAETVTIEGSSFSKILKKLWG